MSPRLSPDTSTVPTDIVRCTACGSVFPMAETKDGDLHPAGTDGLCVCGGDEFDVIEGTIQRTRERSGL